MKFVIGTDPQDADVKAIADELARLTKEVGKLQGQRDALKDQEALQREKLSLQGQIETLKIEKDRLIEANDRKIREVTHDTGLLRKQIEHDTKMATERAKLEVEQANLDADKERFEDKMDFMTKRMEKENSYVRELLEKVLDRLPNVDEHVTVELGQPKAPAAKGEASSKDD